MKNKNGEEKKHGSLLKNFKQTFCVFFFFPFTVTGISERSSKNVDFITYLRQTVHCAAKCLHIFIQLPHSRFLSCARIEKKMVNRLLYTVFHQKLV